MGKIALLVVDDDPPIRKLLECVARRVGLDVDSAKDGLQALEMLERKQYEIAIVDLMMPRLSGYELLQKIAALDPRPSVIVATAMANSGVASLDDSMIRRVIRKPFDIDALSRALVETATEISQRALAAPGMTIVAPEMTAMAPEVTIAPPEAAALPVFAPIPEADVPAVEMRRDEKAAESPSEPPRDELQPE